MIQAVDYVSDRAKRLEVQVRAGIDPSGVDRITAHEAVASRVAAY